LNAITEELHSPIDSVKSYVDSLGSEMYGSLNDAQRRLVTAVDRSVSIQKALVTDLTDFASAQRGKLQMRRERISLDKLGPETIAVVQERYTAKNILFMSSFANGFPPVFADRIRTAQIFEHVLDWAGGFSLPGGRVGLNATFEPGNVIISVTDTSRGLTEEERARVFDLFYLPEGMHDSSAVRNGNNGTSGNGANGSNTNQEQQTTTVKVGTIQGLGLALAKALIEQHGGTISVTSEKNKGNTFTFTLPTTN
jgi:signal transduction histidine kinase